MDVTSESLNLWFVCIDDFGLRSLKFWNKLGDVVNLCVVKDARLDLLVLISKSTSSRTHAN
jgi:hypothetical protein